MDVINNDPSMENLVTTDAPHSPLDAKKRETILQKNAPAESDSSPAIRMASELKNAKYEQHSLKESDNSQRSEYSNKNPISFRLRDSPDQKSPNN